MIKIKLKPTVGLFGALFNKEGKILIKKRPDKFSFPGDWDLPGGAVEEEDCVETLDERIVREVLIREVFEETGIRILVDPMPPMYPAVLRGAGDWAFIIPVGIYEKSETGGEAQEIMFASPKDVVRLAKNPQGNRIVSGEGKRMNRLILKGFTYSPNENYRWESKMFLGEIQSKWK